MPLTLLLPLVVGGIIGIVLLVHVTRDRRPARLPDRDTLERLWRETAPDQRAGIIPAKDGCSALVSDDGEALGLFWLVLRRGGRYGTALANSLPKTAMRS